MAGMGKRVREEERQKGQDRKAEKEWERQGDGECTYYGEEGEETQKEEKKKRWIERQESSRKGKGMMSVLMKAEGWKRGERKKGWDGKAEEQQER